MIIKNTEGKVITTSHSEATFKGAKITDKIYPDNTSGYYMYYHVNENDQIWLDIVFSVKNTSSALFNLYEAVGNLEAVYDSKYRYNSCGLYLSTGSSLSQLYKYVSNSIDALQEATLHITVQLPREVMDNDKPIEVKFTFDGKKQILEFR